MTSIAIIGSGIIGAILAHRLTEAGFTIEVFEKGPAYPYPHGPQFQARHVHLDPNFDAPYHPPETVKNSTQDGLPFAVEGERFMRVGGSATVWEAITIRMTPPDFKPRTLFGYGDDWPIDYDDVEPYYGEAERLLGVSGTDQDNPFAPPRSSPYPLPPFALAYDDQILAERLLSDDIVLHSTPQARTRLPYDGRAGCANYGTCRQCPIAVRYSPQHHLNRALASERCTLHTETSVRRILLDADGRARGLLTNDGSGDVERGFDRVIVAAGALESARLLLLSSDDRYPDGLGNAGGQVGRGLAFHNVWTGRMRYDEDLYPFRFGGWTGQSLQFLNAETRGQHAALKVEFASRRAYDPQLTWGDLDDLHAALQPQLQWRPIVLQSETFSTPERYVTLSTQTDRYDDPFAHVHYRLHDFDAATYDFARSVFDRFVRSTRAVQSEMPPIDWYTSGSHHMGTCRMGDSAETSVTDSFGAVHGHAGLYLAGGSVFVGSGGASNPTLTMLALALRTADYVIDAG